MKTVAVTGATGFIGSRLIPRLRSEGYAVRALTRRPPPAAPGDGPGAVEWVMGDIADAASLLTLVSETVAVVHCAGLVKARTRDAFFAANADAVVRVGEAMTRAAPSARLVHLSSLAAREPGLSDYTASKAAGEAALGALPPGVDWTALRPPAVYGPGDREILKILKGLGYGIGFVPGPDHRLSMIHVDDLVAAIVAVLAAPPDALARRILELDDGRAGGYTIAEIYTIASDLMEKTPRLLQIPQSLLTFAAEANSAIARLARRTPMVTPGKVREFMHPDWVARSPLLTETSVWRPAIPLTEGMASTLAWYRRMGYL